MDANKTIKQKRKFTLILIDKHFNASKCFTFNEVHKCLAKAFMFYDGLRVRNSSLYCPQGRHKGNRRVD